MKPQSNSRIKGSDYEYMEALAADDSDAVRAFISVYGEACWSSVRLLFRYGIVHGLELAHNRLADAAPDQDDGGNYTAARLEIAALCFDRARRYGLLPDERQREAEQ